jgi:hypothetical protein
MFLIYMHIYKTKPLAILLKPSVIAVTVTDDIIFLWFIQRRLISFEVYFAGEQRTIHVGVIILFLIYLTILPAVHYGASNM